MKKSLRNKFKGYSIPNKIGIIGAFASIISIFVGIFLFFIQQSHDNQKSVEGIYKRAKIAFKKNDFHKAEELYKNVYEKKPDFPNLAYNYILTLFQLKKYKEATYIIPLIPKYDNENFHKDFLLASIFYNTKNFQKSKNYIKRSLGKYTTKDVKYWLAKRMEFSIENLHSTNDEYYTNANKFIKKIKNEQYLSKKHCIDSDVNLYANIHRLALLDIILFQTYLSMGDKYCINKFCYMALNFYIKAFDISVKYLNNDFYRFRISKCLFYKTLVKFSKFLSDDFNSSKKKINSITLNSLKDIIDKITANSKPDYLMIDLCNLIQKMFFNRNNKIIIYSDGLGLKFNLKSKITSNKSIKEIYFISNIFNVNKYPVIIKNGRINFSKKIKLPKNKSFDKEIDFKFLIKTHNSETGELDIYPSIFINKQIIKCDDKIDVEIFFSFDNML